MLNHGDRLNIDEYHQRLAELYATAPASPDRMQTRALDRAELDLVIDHRLGIRFPRERRDALWATQEQIRARRGILLLSAVFGRLLPLSQKRSAAQRVEAEYAKVLGAEELRRFLHAGSQPGAN